MATVIICKFLTRRPLPLLWTTLIRLRLALQRPPLSCARKHRPDNSRVSRNSSERSHGSEDRTSPWLETSTWTAQTPSRYRWTKVFAVPKPCTGSGGKNRAAMSSRRPAWAQERRHGSVPAGTRLSPPSTWGNRFRIVCAKRICGRSWKAWPPDMARWRCWSLSDNMLRR